jgi:hypothetical protein
MNNSAGVAVIALIGKFFNQHRHLALPVLVQAISDRQSVGI